MQTATWKQALKGIVKPMKKPDWDKLGLLTKWLIATRASVLIMTALSAIIAILISIGLGKFNLVNSIILVVSLVLAHATNNMLNDWSDWRRKVDEGDYFRSRYGVEPLEHKLMTEKELLTYAGVTGFIAALGGFYLIMQSPNIGLGIGLFLLVAFFLLFYTWPLKYLGLGELAVIIVWGPLMIGGGYYVITGDWSWNVILAGLPYALGVTGVIFGKHIDKYSEDKKKGIHTFPVIIGEKAARYVMIAAVLLQYVITTDLVITGFFTPIMLLVWVSFIGFPALRAKISVPQLIKIFSKPRPDKQPKDWRGWPLYFASIAFGQNERYGLWFVFALLIQTIAKLVFKF